MAQLFFDSKPVSNWKSIPMPEPEAVPDPNEGMTQVQVIIEQLTAKLAALTDPVIAQLTALHESGATVSLVYALFAFSVTALSVRGLQKRWLRSRAQSAS